MSGPATRGCTGSLLPEGRHLPHLPAKAAHGALGKANPGGTGLPAQWTAPGTGVEPDNPFTTLSQTLRAGRREFAWQGRR